MNRLPESNREGLVFPVRRGGALGARGRRLRLQLHGSEPERIGHHRDRAEAHGGGGAFLDQRSVLLGHAVHLVDGFTDLLDAAADVGEPALIVALDGITDPRNLGAIVRSAAAFGAHGVVIPERRSAGMTAAAWKTSAGAAARVPVARATNLTRALTAYANAGAMVVGLAAGGTSLDDLDPDLATGPVVVVVGSEGDGLSRLVAERCDLLVGVPMTQSTESLNAGVAASVALYEVSRLRRLSR